MPSTSSSRPLLAVLRNNSRGFRERSGIGLTNQAKGPATRTAPANISDAANVSRSRRQPPRQRPAAERPSKHPHSLRRSGATLGPPRDCRGLTCLRCCTGHLVGDSTGPARRGKGASSVAHDVLDVIGAVTCPISAQSRTLPAPEWMLIALSKQNVGIYCAAGQPSAHRGVPLDLVGAIARMALRSRQHRAGRFGRAGAARAGLASRSRCAFLHPGAEFRRQLLGR